MMMMRKSFSEKRKENKRKKNVWVSKQKYFLILLKINIQIKKRKEKKEIKKEQKATPASLARAVPSNNDWVSEQINISALARNKERKKENKKEREKKRRKKERENEKKERKACCTSNYDAPYLTTTRQRGNELPPARKKSSLILLKIGSDDIQSK